MLATGGNQYGEIEGTDGSPGSRAPAALSIILVIGGGLRLRCP
jgi:hypothetical protein